MDWRQPWLWPPASQWVCHVAAVAAGGLLLSPWCWQSWQSWQTARNAHAMLQAQQQATHALRTQIEQLQGAQHEPPHALTEVTAWTQLAQQHGLQFSALTFDKPEAHERWAGWQQLPVQVNVHGSWQAWLDWLSQAATQAPGVTVSTLLLKADPRGGISAQLQADFVQSRAEAPSFQLAAVGSDLASPDPFSPQHWAHTQQAHAAQHPSYVRWVAPERARPREPLEHFARDRLRYVGHLTSGNAREALVEVLPAAGAKQDKAMLTVYRVRVGDHLGTHFGKVLRIDNDQVVLQELVWLPSGEWQPMEVHMTLHEGAP